MHLIRLSRNHGQQRAMLAGLDHAHGELVFAIDVDLEERPEDLVLLLDALRMERADAAYGIMERRHGGFARRTLGRLFHRIMTRLASVDIPPDQLWARLMTRRYVREVCRFTEYHLYLGGIFQLVGFTQVAVILQKGFNQSSSYSAWKRFVAAMDALTSFSVAPLYALCIAGLGVVALCGILAAEIIIQKLVFGVSIQGWTTLAVLLCRSWAWNADAGILGIYVGRSSPRSNNGRSADQSSTVHPAKDQPSDVPANEATLRA